MTSCPEIRVISGRIKADQFATEDRRHSGAIEAADTRLRGSRRLPSDIGARDQAYVAADDARSLAYRTAAS
jgi:hypothetical protein